jgi:type III restriction enzyme
MTLPLFSLKTYQLETLKALRSYLQKAVELNDANTAFYQQTKRTYLEPPGLPGLPYVCLRIPTGGGKTILAAHSIAVAADAFVQTDRPVVLWLVPSQTIREQTLETLQNREHPNRRALAERFGENVRIMGVPDALYAKRADYDGGLVVIVATLAAFRRDDKEGLKVYQPNGELMDHFSGLHTDTRAVLEQGPAGDPSPSLANVLRLRRPIVIVDEAHNARTELFFETVGNLKPSVILEFTATPITPAEHKPDKGIHASNVLHFVSASELKAAEMIKLPVILRGRSDPRETIRDAIIQLEELDAVAGRERAATAEFIRPVMLIQSEAKSKERETLHAETVRAMLHDDFKVPPEHVVVATGDTKELDGVNLFDPACTIRFIITQQALKEGWDCSFAYVLCSVAEQKSPRAVEQLLGRILRLPRAKRKGHEELNRAYAFATTTSFQQAAQTLKDGLVANGFERVEASALVRTVEEPLPGMNEGGAAFVFEEQLPAGLDVASFKTNVETATGGRVRIDAATGTMTVRGALTDYDKTALLLAMPEAAAATVTTLVHKSRGARLRAPDEAINAVRFAVPRLAVRRPNGLELFDRAHFLDHPWRIEEFDPSPILDHFTTPRSEGESAEIDIDDRKQLQINPIREMHRQLSLTYGERELTDKQLINWIDRKLVANAVRPDITKPSSTLFIAKALELLQTKRGIPLAELARAQFRLVEAFARTIAQLRDANEATAFQRALFPASGLEFETSPDVELVFEEGRYGYREPYKGAPFDKHFMPFVGDLAASGEEYDCAVYLDRHPKVKTWVRNTDRKDHSFWLESRPDRFYPDFIALLNDGRILVVEYKGEHLITGDPAKNDRLIGELWAERSNGRCLFAMVTNRQWGTIDRAIGI